jgi:heme-degrading monooxygenase HmoA
VRRPDLPYVIVWRYRVPEDRRSMFEAAYGPRGPWAKLFGRHQGYLGTELLRGDAPGSYVTIDRWTAKGAFDSFMLEAREEYERLDAELEPLTDSEELIARGTASEATR